MNKATAAQASFAASLASKLDRETVERIAAEAARVNQNAPLNMDGETVVRFTRRLSKTAASKFIDGLKNA